MGSNGHAAWARIGEEQPFQAFAVQPDSKMG
jgi:hypothetical protein